MDITLSLTLLLTLLAVVALVLAIAREIRRDGYGSRPAPCSHHGWDEGVTL